MSCGKPAVPGRERLLAGLVWLLTPVLQVLAFLGLMLLSLAAGVSLIVVVFVATFLAVVLSLAAILGAAWTVAYVLSLFLACLDATSVTHETDITQTRFVYEGSAGCSRQAE